MPAGMTPIRVTHVINGLGVGGAETMLYRLLSASDRARFHHRVISLTDVGAIGKRMAALGLPVEALGMRRGLGDLAVPLRLARNLSRGSPSLVQTWMYHADLVGGLAARLAGSGPVIWNIRQSTLEPGLSKRTTIWTRRLCARLSRLVPQRIVCCSQVARDVHVRLGYAADKFVVIPNGFDLDEFRPDTAARQAVREELGIAPEMALVGGVGRWDPQKDYRTFVAAAARLAAEAPESRFLLCGEGLVWDNALLSGWIARAGLADRFVLLGHRDDIARVTAALDIAGSSSAYGEGFPNVVAEAMACAVPCAVTEVGDSAMLVAATGRTVPPAEPDALAGAWKELLDLGPEGRASLGAAARARIARDFSLASVVARYERLYVEAAGAP